MQVVIQVWILFIMAGAADDDMDMDYIPRLILLRLAGDQDHLPWPVLALVGLGLDL